MDGINTMGGLGSPQYLQKAYANMVQMNDMASNLCDEEGLGFNSSVFGSQFGQYGQYGQYGQNGYRYPGMETQNMSLIDLDAYQTQRQKLQMSHQIELQKRAASAEFEISGADSAIKNNVGFLSDAIKENNQDEVKELYAKVKDAVKHKLAESGVVEPNASTEAGKAYNDKVNAYVNDLYYRTTNTNLVEDLRTNGNGSFVSGLKSGLDPFHFFTNETSLASNIQAVGGPKPSETESSSKAVGFAVGLTGALLALPLLLIGGGKLLRAGAKGETSLVKSMFNGEGYKGIFKSGPLKGEKLTAKISEINTALSKANKLNKGKTGSPETQKLVDDLTEALKLHKDMAYQEQLVNLGKVAA